MAVVTPPVSHPCFDRFVVSPLRVTRTAVDACPAVRLPAVIFEHNRAVRLGVRDAPVCGHVVIRAHVVITLEIFRGATEGLVIKHPILVIFTNPEKWG